MLASRKCVAGFIAVVIKNRFSFWFSFLLSFLCQPSPPSSPNPQYQSLSAGIWSSTLTLEKQYQWYSHGDWPHCAPATARHLIYLNSSNLHHGPEGVHSLLHMRKCQSREGRTHAPGYLANSAGARIQTQSGLNPESTLWATLSPSISRVSDHLSVLIGLWSMCWGSRYSLSSEEAHISHIPTSEVC